jgi:hypothetical protein
MMWTGFIWLMTGSSGGCFKHDVEDSDKGNECTGPLRIVFRITLQPGVGLIRF